MSVKSDLEKLLGGPKARAIVEAVEGLIAETVKTLIEDATPGFLDPIVGLVLGELTRLAQSETETALSGIGEGSTTVEDVTGTPAAITPPGTPSAVHVSPARAAELAKLGPAEIAHLAKLHGLAVTK